MTPEHFALALMEIIRHHVVAKIRRRAERYNGAAEAALDEAEQFYNFATRMMSYVSGVVPPAMQETEPETEPAADDKREASGDGTSQPQMAYFRAVGDCGQPHVSIKDAIACTEGRRARGIPLSEDDQQIMESVKASINSSSSASAPAHGRRKVRRLVPVPSPPRKDDPAEVGKRHVEPGPFAPSSTQSAAPPVTEDHLVVGVDHTGEDA